jgi:hypothetical protein
MKEKKYESNTYLLPSIFIDIIIILWWLEMSIKNTTLIIIFFLHLGNGIWLPCPGSFIIKCQSK